MGNPKQKWTSGEEEALKAGVVKHGSGKWQTILKDPDFSGVLSSRSNVDLKDKWRNMSVTTNGFGSREKPRLAKSSPVVKHEENTADFDEFIQIIEEILEPTPLATSNEYQAAGPKLTFSQPENLIIEAITNLKESGGSNKTSITAYIEDQYTAPPNFRSILSEKLNELTASGKVFKVKGKYRIVPIGVQAKRRGTEIPEGRQRGGSRTAARSEIEVDFEKMKSMGAEAAARVAARAVADAESARAKAEEACRDAVEAEADSKAAQAFAEAVEAALLALNARSTDSLAPMIHA